MGIVFLRSQEIGHDCLKEILKQKIEIDAVFTFKPDINEHWEKSVDSIAKEESISLYHDEEFTIKKIEELKPELIIVAGFRKIIPKDILKIPKRGIVALHASLLPDLKGQAPLNWAILLDRKKTGITMFFMDEGIDTGEIIDQEEFEISVNDTIRDLKNKARSCAVELLSKNLKAVLTGESNRVKQISNGTYGCARIPDDGKIDWSKSSRQIYNLIRSSEEPYLAFCMLNQEKIFISKAEMIDEKRHFFGTPGQIGLTFKDQSAYVITGDGVLKILKIRKDGTEFNAKEYFKTSKIRLR